MVKCLNLCQVSTQYGYVTTTATLCNVLIRLSLFIPQRHNTVIISLWTFSSTSGASNASTSKPSKESETSGGGSNKKEKDFDLYDFRVESDEEQSADNRYVQGGPSAGVPGLSLPWFGLFHHPAWAASSSSSGRIAGELSKSKSTQPRFAIRWSNL